MEYQLLLVLGLSTVIHGLPTPTGQRDTFAISSDTFMDELLRSSKSKVLSLTRSLEGGPETAGARNKHLQALVRSIDGELQKTGREARGKQQPESAKCSCIQYNCGCCIKVERWNETACANFSYLPAPEYGISATLTLNGKTLVNETVSVKNPPPICAGVPYLEKYASICLRFYNLTYSNKSLTGCARVEIRLEALVVEDYNLGCFKIPPGGPVHKADNHRAYVIKGGHPQRKGVKFYFRRKGDMPWKYNGL